MKRMRKYAFLVWSRDADAERSPGSRVVVEAVNSFVAYSDAHKTEFVTRIREVDLVEQPENWKPVRRASGEAPCDFCGEILDTHQQPTRATAPTVVIDCAGNWWKT